MGEREKGGNKRLSKKQYKPQTCLPAGRVHRVFTESAEK